MTGYVVTWEGTCMFLVPIAEVWVTWALGASKPRTCIFGLGMAYTRRAGMVAPCCVTKFFFRLKSRTTPM